MRTVSSQFGAALRVVAIPTQPVRIELGVLVLAARYN